MAICYKSIISSIKTHASMCSVLDLVQFHL